MGTNKNASIRYQTLDKCFRDRHVHYDIQALLEKCEEALLEYCGIAGVSRRQLFEDIKYMESDAGWSIPLMRGKNGKKTYYFYEDPDFSINKQPLTDDEARQLETAIVTLSRFRGLPNNEWIEEVISSLEWRFNLKRSDHSIISFEQNQRLKGLQYLRPIVDATIHKQVIKLIYRSYNELSVEREVIIHPYHLQEYNNRWFLLALDNENRYISNFALDRIHSVEVMQDVTYIPNDSIDFNKYFDDVIGVTIPNNEVDKLHIVFQLSEHQYAYVISKPLHFSQKIQDNEKRILSIDVIPNYELDYAMLSLGPDVEVLEPISYREHIRQKLVDSLKKYDAVKMDCTSVD